MLSPRPCRQTSHRKSAPSFLQRSRPPGVPARQPVPSSPARRAGAHTCGPGALRSRNERGKGHNQVHVLRAPGLPTTSCSSAPGPSPAASHKLTSVCGCRTRDGDFWSEPPPDQPAGFAPSVRSPDLPGSPKPGSFSSKVALKAKQWRQQLPRWKSMAFSHVSFAPMPRLSPACRSAGVHSLFFVNPNQCHSLLIAHCPQDRPSSGTYSTELTRRTF